MRKIILGALLSCAVACTMSEGNNKGAIVGGVAATEFPEAILVDNISNGRVESVCSGVMIAPRVAVTAGHCVYSTYWHATDAPTTVRVTAPRAQNQTADVARIYVYDYTFERNLPMQAHDVALLVLDRDITMQTY